MAINTEFPSWMLTRESPIDAIAKGIQAGTALAQTRQAGQRLALAAQEQQQRMELQNKQFELTAESQGLRNQLLSEQIEADKHDQPLLLDYGSRITNARTADEIIGTPFPGLKKPSNIVVAQSMAGNKLKMLTSSSEFQAEQSISQDYNTVLKWNPARTVSTLGPYPKGSEQWYKGLTQLVSDKRTEDQAAEIAKRTASATIAATSRENIANITAQSREDIARMKLEESEKAKTSGEAVPVTMEGTGETVPGMVKFWTGRTWQYRNVHNPNDVKNMTPAQLESGLGKLISSYQKDAASGDTNAAAQVQIYRQQLADMLKGNRPANAPKDKVLIWDEQTNDFKK